MGVLASFPSKHKGLMIVGAAVLLGLLGGLFFGFAGRIGGSDPNIIQSGLGFVLLSMLVVATVGWYRVTYEEEGLIGGSGCLQLVVASLLGLMTAFGFGIALYFIVLMVVFFRDVREARRAQLPTREKAVPPVETDGSRISSESAPAESGVPESGADPKPSTGSEDQPAPTVDSRPPPETQALLRRYQDMPASELVALWEIGALQPDAALLLKAELSRRGILLKQRDAEDN